MPRQHAFGMQVKDVLRASMSTAARAAAQGPRGTLPQGSALLWALLQHCLRQQAEALIEQQTYKAAAKEAMAQVGSPCSPHDHDHVRCPATAVHLTTHAER